MIAVHLAKELWVLNTAYKLFGFEAQFAEWTNLHWARCEL